MKQGAYTTGYTRGESFDAALARLRETAEWRMLVGVRERHRARPSDGADRAAVADGPEPDPAQPVTAQPAVVLAQAHWDDSHMTSHEV